MKFGHFLCISLNRSYFRDKDGSIEKMPTDFVGMIYKSVDLSNEQSVAERVRDWLKADLRIGKALGSQWRP